MKLKNFLPTLKYVFQGHYRAFIIRQYVKFNLTNEDLATKIVRHAACLGTHPSCGCPMAEFLLSDKEDPCNESN